MGREYLDSQMRLDRLSIRILESDPFIPLTLTLIVLGLPQRTKHTGLFIDENVASTIFQKFSFKIEF